MEQAFLDDIKNINDNDWYDGNKNLISVLIFLDVCLTLQSKSIDRLPVNAFTRMEGEDIEHILSQTPNEEDRIDEDAYKRNMTFLITVREILYRAISHQFIHFSLHLRN